MRVAVRTVLVGLLAGLLTTLGPGPASSGAAAVEPSAGSATESSPDPGRVVSRSVSFSVENLNRTPVACPADGAPYQLTGRLVGPRRELRAPTAPRINVLVHDITAGAWFWHLRSHPRFDYAGQLAKQGEVSLVIDRLGYDGSPLPDGNDTCLGAQADMLHQVVAQLRAGEHAGVPVPDSVVLHGHSVGAAVAEIEAATFGDVDGLVVMSWADGGASQRAVTEAAEQTTHCLAGGEQTDTGEHYAPYGRTKREFRELLFFSAPDRIQRTAAGLRNFDPCGDALSLGPLVATANVETRAITVPVLLLFGAKDVLNRPDAASMQAMAYAPSAEVTSHTLRRAGSALPLEGPARRTRALVLDWLCTSFRC